MRDLLTFDFCQMEIYDNHIITTINDGEHIVVEQHKVLLDVAQTYFKNSNFFYLSNRINSYSLDPKVYYQVSKIENLVGLAIISDNNKAIGNAQIEKLFYNKPYKIFSNMKEAIEWGNDIINNT
ncbi:hypothetical protein [Winogradskyella endarachnes]|uniref:STAS/SEC14 domain-containing protein n=1 Tax=Winogradskyella endarachnes TaxID=2681965 RepID=A0A6L6U5E1_9FLAO|nr:hypothetical protein [Winogradskyella endarachnes]MUU77278.1 hypothetical protein [Winogradskyella endarachnes]